MSRPRVVIIGGAITGASVAWHLARETGFPCEISVIERDPSYARASTALAASGIRHQFSTETNIRISQYGTEFLRAFRGPDGERITFRENGYLILAGSEEDAAALRRAHALQTALGADVELLDPAGLARAFPHLETGDLLLGSFGRSGEGWFDNMGLLRGFREGSRAAGVTWLRDTAVGLEIEGGRATGVRLASGDVLQADWVVNAAGTRAAEVAGWAGVPLPVEPRKRTVFTFRCQTPPEGRLPLMIDASRLWCRPEGEGFIAGIGPDPDPAVDPNDFEPRSTEFEEVVWPLLAARARCFEALRLTGIWAGHYAWNTVDQNAILGPAPGCPNLLLANGFSGHGLQQAPAVGRGIAEWIAHGRWVSLDLSPLGLERLAAAPEVERAVY